MIDQRRAHERILYERMLQALSTTATAGTAVLVSGNDFLNAADYQVCLEMMGDLEKLGFDIRDFGNNSVVVHGFPADMNPARCCATPWR